jgi:hypothetical protein
MLEAQLAMLRFPLGWEFAKALCLGFFLGEVCPTLCAQPAFGAGLHATLWQPVTLTGIAKFKTHDDHQATKRAAMPMPMAMASTGPWMRCQRLGLRPYP